MFIYLINISILFLSNKILIISLYIMVFNYFKTFENLSFVETTSLNILSNIINKLKVIF